MAGRNPAPEGSPRAARHVRRWQDLWFARGVAPRDQPVRRSTGSLRSGTQDGRRQARRHNSLRRCRGELCRQDRIRRYAYHGHLFLGLPARSRGERRAALSGLSRRSPLQGTGPRPTGRALRVLPMVEQTPAANAPPREKRRPGFLTWAALLIILPLGMPGAHAQLRGHGGPVRALAISADGQTAISGSFDSTAIRWSLTRNAAEQVLRFHADAVNAVVWLRDGRAATAGADGRIAIWTSGKAEPDAVLEGHSAPIVALAASPDGATLASASWDHTVRLWPLAGGAPRVLDEHTQNVNGVVFTADGRALISVSYDLSVRIWPLSGASTPTVVSMPTPLNAVAAASDGEIAVGGADGKVYFLSASGARMGEVAAGPRPVISIAISPDGALVAAAGIGGTVAVIDRKARTLARTLVGPGLPVWSVAFLPDGRTLLTGGTDNIIRRWNAVTGDSIDPMLLEATGDPL